MRSKEYRKKLIKRINSYKRSRRQFIVWSRIFDTIGFIGFALVVIGYMVYTDASIGISSVSIETGQLISFFGFVVGAIGICVGLSLRNEANEYQSRIDRIHDMIIR